MLRFIDSVRCVTHATNPKKVKAYKKALEKGAEFPPIEVMEYKGWFYVLDGAHRTKAHEGDILAFVFSAEDCPKKYLLGRRIPKDSDIR